MRATETIEHRECFLAVPVRVMITLEKARKDPDLESIFGGEGF